MPKILKVKDESDSNVIYKDLIPSLSARIILCGRTGASKTSVIVNLMGQPDFYGNDFKGENIVIMSGSLEGDLKLQKLIKYLQIPDSNLFDSYDERSCEIFYDLFVEDFNDAMEKKEKVEPKMFIFDDLSFTNLFSRARKNSQIERIFNNGRKYQISCIISCQKYTQLNTNIRENSSGAFLYQATNKQLELIEKDYNYIGDKKKFMKMMHDNTKDIHDFVFINIYNPLETRYLDKDFKPISF